MSNTTAEFPTIRYNHSAHITALTDIQGILLPLQDAYDNYIELGLAALPIANIAALIKVVRGGSAAIKTSFAELTPDKVLHGLKLKRDNIVNEIVWPSFTEFDKAANLCRELISKMSSGRLSYLELVAGVVTFPDDEQRRLSESFKVRADDEAWLNVYNAAKDFAAAFKRLKSTAAVVNRAALLSKVGDMIDKDGNLIDNALLDVLTVMVTEQYS